MSIVNNEQLNEAVNGISDNNDGIPTPPGFQVSGPADPVEEKPQEPTQEEVTMEAPEEPQVVNGQEQAPDFEDVRDVQDSVDEEPEQEETQVSEPTQPSQPVEAPAAEETSAPVEEPVKETQVPQPSQSKQQNVKAKKIVQRHLDGFSALPQIIKIKNETLRYAIDLYFRNPKKEQVEAELDIQGEIMKKFDAECIFEEGGATASEGHALLVANPDGTPVSPFFVYISSHNNVVNGRHAMFRIGAGFYVLVAGQKQGRSFVAVYYISSVYGVTKDIPNPRFHGELVGYLANGEHWTDVKAAGMDSSWSKDHPAVQAAQRRIFELYATTPAYAAPYAEDRFCADDFNKCVTDKEFAAHRIEEPDLATAYEHAAEPLMEFLDDESNDRKYLPLMTICLQYSKADNTVTAFILSTYFNFETRSSEGFRKYYGRAVLKEGDIFYYPDKDAQHGLTFEELRDRIVANGGATGIAFRRMTLD